MSQQHQSAVAVAAVVNAPLVGGATTYGALFNGTAPKVRKASTCSVCHTVGHTKTYHNKHKCGVCDSLTHETHFHARVSTIHQTLLEMGTYSNSIARFLAHIRTNYATYDLKEVARFLGAIFDARTVGVSQNRDIEQDVFMRLTAYYYCLAHQDDVTDALYAQYEHPEAEFMTRNNSAWFSNMVKVRFAHEIQASRTRELARTEAIRVEALRVASTANFVNNRYKNSFVTKILADENPEEMKEACECPICYDTVEKMDVITTECGHNYCSPCYEKYMLSVISTKTPCCCSCRAVITTVTVYA